MKKKTKYYISKTILVAILLAIIGVGGYLALAKYNFNLNQYNITQDQGYFNASKNFRILGHIVLGIAVIMGTFGNNLIDIFFFVPKEKRKKYFFRLFSLFGFSIIYITLLLIFIKQYFIQEYGIYFVYGIGLFNTLMALIFFVKIKDNFGIDSEEQKSIS